MEVQIVAKVKSGLLMWPRFHSLYSSNHKGVQIDSDASIFKNNKSEIVRIPHEKCLLSKKNCLNAKKIRVE